MRPKRTKQSGVANVGVGRGADCPLGLLKNWEGEKKIGNGKEKGERKNKKGKG